MEEEKEMNNKSPSHIPVLIEQESKTARIYPKRGGDRGRSMAFSNELGNAIIKATSAVTKSWQLSREQEKVRGAGA